jgi:hypothetical protein
MTMLGSDAAPGSRGKQGTERKQQFWIRNGQRLFD